MTHATLAIPFALALLQSPDTTPVMPHVPLGTTIRIETRSLREGKVEGVLSEKNQGFLSARVGEADNATVSVPWALITALSADAGRERKGGAARGTLAGASAALVVSSSISNPVAAAAAGMVLPVAGGLLGWLHGFARWEPVHWRPAIDSVMEREATRIHVAPGTPVVVRAGRDANAGDVVGTSEDSLVLRDGATTTTLALADITELRLRGRRDRLRGAALGFSAMALASGIHIMTARPSTTTKQRIIIGYALAGGALGALIGAPGWRRVPVPVR